MTATVTEPAPASAELDGRTAPPVDGARTGRAKPHGVSLLVLAAGLALTAVLVGVTRSAHERNEDRLLRERTKQAAAVLTAAVPGIQTPLASAVEVAEQGEGAQEPFRRLMRPLVQTGGPFVSASLWQVDRVPVAPSLVVGVEPKLTSQPEDAIRRILERSARTTGLGVVGLLDGDDPRLGYLYTSDADAVTYVVYAEAGLPPDRTSVQPADSAFAGLHHAIYLGDAETDGTLLTASTAELPIEGRRATELVDFGDTRLLLVMTPTTTLGGRLLGALPWLVGAVGGISALAATLLIEQLLRRRDQANLLAAENHALYANQLSVSLTLQHSLLPSRLPDVPGLEVAVRYVPGVAGLDIGGDWYDVIDLDERHVMIVVGDVSGRGLEAGTVMASLRYATRAFASRDDAPADILAGLAGLLDVVRDGHFATVICAVVDVPGHTITVANAGHPPPLAIDADGVVDFLHTDVGPPIGVATTAAYGSLTHPVSPGTSVILFTDGVFERGGETVDVGLERLRRSVPTDATRVDETLDRLLAKQLTVASHDDSALVGVRWTTNATTS